MTKANKYARIRASVTLKFKNLLEVEAARTHLRLPSLVRQLLAEALEVRRLNEVQLPKQRYIIKVSETEKKRLEDLAYTLSEVTETC